jgi:hypothetical protein
VRAAFSAYLLLASLAGAGEGEAAVRETVCPRVAAAPALDGKLDEPCWQAAAALSDFTPPQSKQAPAKRVQARICFDDQALYLGVVCEEPQPGRIRARATGKSSEVWLDDCVEVWIRTTDSALEFDQFIVNTLGTRQSLRRRQGAAAPWEPAWRAAVAKGEKEWVAEFAIPFGDLGLRTPARGEMIQLKIGREDYTAEPAALSTWPPGSRYAGTEDFAPVYLEDANLLRNADFAERAGGKAAGWSFSENGKDAALFASEPEAGHHVIHFSAPGRYCTAGQSLKLKPDAWYRLTARVKGGAGVYLRARTVLKAGGPSVPHTVTAKPSTEYGTAEVLFPTGPSGEAAIIIGGDEPLGKGEVRIAGLRVVREAGVRDFGPRIPVAADAPQPTTVTKLLVTDCRALRGFIGTPVDGTEASRDWAGEEYEYNRGGRASAGVGYSYQGNDGLHVSFADAQGFHAVLIRGGAKVKLYRDGDRYDEPGKGVLVSEFPGRCKTSRALFKDPVKTDHVSFFGLTDGYLANVSFFRVAQGRGELPEPAGFSAGGAVAKVEEPEFAARFPDSARKAYVLESGAGRAPAIEAPAGAAVHLMAAPLTEETPIAAVGLDFVVRGGVEQLPFAAAVQDPLNPRSELFGADFVLDKPGRVRLILDFPDQVVPKGARLWLTLAFGAAVKLEGLDGQGPRVELYRVERAKALPEALAYRKLLMKTYFCSLSEARPWTGWYTDEEIERSLKGKYGPQLRDFRMTIDQCRALSAEDPFVKQFYEWVWRQYRPWRKERNRGVWLDASHAKVGAVAGAPEWAVVARQAWLTARQVPKWWMDHRMVPTGEFGGEVGDDTDQYGNYQDFVMFERDGVAAELLDGAERLAELAEAGNLEEGLNRHTMDPLHAYEEGINHLAVMSWWHYGDPVYFERCLVNARSTEKLTVVTPKGHRHFKSQTEGSADLRMDRKTDEDGGAHPLMWHPTLEVAWYNQNPKALKMLREWADGWLEHMTPGKYATSVEVATEKVTASDPKPFTGVYGGQGSAFLFLYDITGEEKYIRPYLEYLAAGQTDLGLMLVDLARRHGLRDLREKLAANEKVKGAAAFALTGDKAPLLDALKMDLAELQNYGLMYTEAEPFTDRVFLYPLHHAAIAYTGGYATRNKLNHSHAVSWDGFGTDYAALVVETGPQRFKALLYNFTGEARTGRFRLWTLEHGRYRLTLGPDAGAGRAEKVEREENVEIVRGAPLALTLPPKTAMVLGLTQTEKGDDLRLRADLALSPRELKVGGGTVRGIAHNIGSRDVESFEVALVDEKGAVRARKTLGRLEAPLDLTPRRMEFALEGLPADAKGWTLVLDPDERIPEIYEGNNRAAIVRP